MNYSTAKTIVKNYRKSGNVSRKKALRPVAPKPVADTNSPLAPAAPSESAGGPQAKSSLVPGFWGSLLTLHCACGSQ